MILACFRVAGHQAEGRVNWSPGGHRCPLCLGCASPLDHDSGKPSWPFWGGSLLCQGARACVPFSVAALRLLESRLSAWHHRHLGQAVLSCGDCRAHHRRSSAASLGCARESQSSGSSCENHRGLQALPGVRWRAQSPPLLCTGSWGHLMRALPPDTPP